MRLLQQMHPPAEAVLPTVIPQQAVAISPSVCVTPATRVPTAGRATPVLWVHTSLGMDQQHVSCVTQENMLILLLLCRVYRVLHTLNQWRVAATSLTVCAMLAIRVAMTEVAAPASQVSIKATIAVLPAHHVVLASTLNKKAPPLRTRARIVRRERIVRQRATPLRLTVFRVRRANTRTHLEQQSRLTVFRVRRANTRIHPERQHQRPVNSVVLANTLM